MTAALAVVLLFASPATVIEPRTEVSFPVHEDGMTLLGVGVRTKTFLKVKVYATAFYVDDAALAGPLTVHRGRVGTPEFYRDLVWGDFRKAIVMVFVRNTTASQVRDGFYEALPGVDRARLDLLASHFGTPRKGEKVVVRWGPGGVVETTTAAGAKPPIADKPFAGAVFGIWLGEKPIQQDLKRDLVSRAALAIPFP
jgi:Chalcone isomerase-like